MGASSIALTTSSRKAARAAQVRGETNEQRALRAANKIRAWWFLGARLTRHRSKADRLGVDLVIETVDLGAIRVQVKSSERKAAEFVEHGQRLDLRWRIHVLVIRRDDGPEEVLGRLLAVCILAREEAEAAGLTADDPRLCRKEAA